MDKAGYMSLELVDKLTDEILEKYQIKIETIDVSDWSDLKGRKCHVDISWESKIENFNFIS